MLPYEAKLSALGNGAFDGEKQRVVMGWVAALIGAHMAEFQQDFAASRRTEKKRRLLPS